MLDLFIDDDQGSVNQSLGFDADLDVDNLGEVSFMGKSLVDELYDPEICRAESLFRDHENDFYDSNTMKEAETALDRMETDIKRIEYWENCKKEAELQSERREIFINGINAKLDIIEKYRKH